MDSQSLMDEAAKLAKRGVKKGHGGPFGAVIVKRGSIIGKGWNQTFIRCDPTAHAEIQAIRDACRKVKRLELIGAVMYCTAEPCPMCMSAIYWARLDGVYFANTKEQSADFGFDDSNVYHELGLSWKERSVSMAHFPNEAAMEVFKYWASRKARAVAKGKSI